ncbi:MAG: flippase-like domain-containing protein [Elusimicrobia bacterium]|nr:flippase-like domain-containing protein [Elusimicrobiota bacterium]
MKKNLKFFLKLFFGVGILVLLFSKTTVQEFVRLLIEADYKFFIFSLVLYIIGQIISAKKWMVISQNLNFEYKFSNYLKWYFLGMFYNMFLPTNIGGDVVKATKIKDNKPYCIKRAIISVLSDRITGLFVLVLFILCGCIFFNRIHWLNILNIVIIFSIFICTILMLYIVKKDNLIPEKYRNTRDLILLIFEKKCIIKFIFLSLIFHSFLIIIHYFIARMYGLEIPFSYYLLLYPITAIVASLPVSINGMGLKELVYVSMLKPFGIDTATAIMFAMTFNMVVLFSGTIGFIPYMDIKRINKNNLQ